jgi:hypothetical protein
VNWVDYAAAARDASPVAFAQHLESLAGATGGQIFLVWAGGYQSFGLQCEGIVQTLQEDPAYHAQALVVGDDNQFYQPMWMVGFTPTKP